MNERGEKVGLFDRFKRPRNNARDEPKSYDLRGVRRTNADWTMTNSEAIYAAVSRISNTIAALPIHVYRGQEPQTDHPLERLLAYAPNLTMTPFTFRQTMEANRNNEGTAYALIVPHPTSAWPERLDVLDPTRVMPMRDIDTGEVWYQLLFEDGQQAIVHNSSMVVLRHMSANGERGIRPVDVLRGTLEYDRDIKEFSTKQLDGVNSGVVLNIPGTGLNRGRKEEIVNQFLEAYKMSGGRLVVLEGGVTATTLTQSPVDAKVLDVERITRNRVATVYNIPPHMLGDYSDTSYATAEQSMLEYLQMTIFPIVTQWQDELERKLLTFDLRRQGYTIRFNLSELWRADIKTMAERDQMAIRSGWKKINEARLADGLPPDENGDELMISRDMVPLRVALETTTTTPLANNERR